MGNEIPKTVRIEKVCDATGLSQSTIKRLEDKGEFPRRIRLSANAVAWRLDEVIHWVETRPRGGVDAPVEANRARRKSEPDSGSAEAA